MWILGWSGYASFMHVLSLNIIVALHILHGQMDMGRFYQGQKPASDDLFATLAIEGAFFHLLLLVTFHVYTPPSSS